MNTSKTQKVYISKDDTVTVTCPNCSTSWTASVERLKDCKGPVKLRCKCGTHFSTLFEFRKTWRKRTHIDGSYVKLPRETELGRIVVENISTTGIGFTTVNSHTLSKGDNLKVTFILDNKDSSEIEKHAVVVQVKDHYVGCEFSNLTEHKKELGFYLMP